MADEFDVELFLEQNLPDIKDYDTYVDALQDEAVTKVVPGTYGGGFGLFAPTGQTKASPEEQWEVIKSVIITQQTIEPYIEYFKTLTEEDAYDKLTQETRDDSFYCKSRSS